MNAPILIPFYNFLHPMNAIRMVHVVRFQRTLPFLPKGIEKTCSPVKMDGIHPPR